MSMILNPYRYAAAGGPTFGNASREFTSASSQNIEVGAVSALNGVSAFTISGWAKKDSSSSDWVIGSQISSSNGFWLQWYTDGSIYFTVRNGGLDYAEYNLSWSSSWYHLAGVYNSANASESVIYVNGSQVASGNGASSGLSATAANDFKVGGFASFFTDGFIADVRLYSRVLSGSEITNLYNGTPVDSTDLEYHGIPDIDDDGEVDYSPNALAGIINNGSTYLPSGPFGVTPALPTFGNASRDFESSESDHVSIGTGPSDLLTDAYTMTAWVKPESFPGNYQTVFGSHSGATYQLLYVKSNGKLALYHTGGSSINYDGTGSETLVTGQWQHVAMTVSSDDGLRGYVNGIEDNAVSGGTITTPSAIWRIGREAFGRYWDGLLSSVRLYNRVLSAEEIETLASNGDVTSGLVGHWLTDEFNYTDVIVDYSGNGNDGTNNGSTYSTDGPFD